MHNLKTLWQMLDREHKRFSVLILFLAFIGTIIEMVGLGLIIPLIHVMTVDDISSLKIPIAGVNEFLLGFQKEEVIGLILLGMVGVFVVKTIYFTFLTWLQSSFTFSLQAVFSKKLLESAMKRDWLAYQKNNSSYYIQNTNNEVVILVQQVYSAAITFLIHIMMLGIYAALLLAVEPYGTMVIAVAIGIALFVFLYLSRLRIAIWGNKRQALEKSRLQTLQQVLGSVKDIKIRESDDFFLGQFDAYNQRLKHIGRWQNTLRLFPRYFFELLAVIGLAAAIVVMMKMGKPMADITPIIALFAAIFIKLMPAVNSILVSVHAIRYYDPTINTIQKELLVKYPTIKKGASTQKNIFEKAHIKIQDVSFQYPEKDAAALKNINIDIPHGKSVGIIGKSGAGKSTLIDVILGLLKPDSGVVHVNEKNIAKHLKSWQRQIGYVPQSIYLFDDTLRRNIAFGVDDKDIDEAALNSAVEQAQLGTLVANLPEGLDTIIGEDGGRLSGGEKQRIALARALYPNPSILLLDEATSSLDSQTEADVMRAVQSLKGGRTILIVTHKMSAIEDCDMVIKIEKSTIVSSSSTV